MKTNTIKIGAALFAMGFCSERLDELKDKLDDDN